MIKSLLIAAVASLGGSAAMAAEATGGTLENLQAAFQGESNAHAKYLAFSTRADAEGYPGAARLFRAAARAEQIHAAAHAQVIKSMGGEAAAKIEAAAVGSTRENLQAALGGESYERDQMYPRFLEKARKDGNARAVRTFNLARNAEIEHARLYQAALDDLEKLRAPGEPVWVCSVCGFTSRELPAKCPSSFSPREKFERVD
ncbi:MAG TPA: rubrerythrin family protein [Myxococcales bacterium]|nr:rubrerythrin family protein [Myxococcales bacterium]